MLLPGERARLTQPRMALHLGSRSNAGGPLLLGQGLTVVPGGGSETAPGVHLREGVRVLGTGVTPPTPLSASPIPYPIAAPATLDGGVKTTPWGRAKRAAAAPATLA